MNDQSSGHSIEGVEMPGNLRHYHPCLNAGWVELLDTMGSDLDIVNAARTSYNKRSTSWSEADERLLRRLVRDNHTSPFEMVEMKFRVKAPLFVARQLVRHRTFSWNEWSARYTRLTLEYYIPSRWRVNNNPNNKQDSQVVDDFAHEEQDAEYRSLMEHVTRFYERSIERGCARELARIGLPESRYTLWIWKANLRNIVHMLSLRLHYDAQYECFEYARAVALFVRSRFPETYRLLVEEKKIPNVNIGL